MTAICIEEPGLLTTVQDLGRKGFRQFGVPVCGAVDTHSLQAANLLVGNPPGAAVLELTMAGPKIKFAAFSVIAVTGADMEARLNGRPLSMGEAVAVHPGDRLEFGWAKSGCRAYLAVGGGIEVPPVMGSKSTYIRGRIGGFQGRPLQKGDCLPVGVPALAPERLAGRRLPAGEFRESGPPWVVRVMPGPQAEYFTGSGWHAFLSQDYRVTKDADRMGCRLEGPAIGHVAGADIISDAVLPGSVQVPGNGRPIVMLSDCNTTGGYAKIATVIKPDLRKVAQARPGDIIRFVAVSFQEAQHMYLSYINCLHYLTDYLGRELFTEPGLNAAPPGGGSTGSGDAPVFPWAARPRTEEEGQVFFVTAPLAGVYFRSAGPGRRPYVLTGDMVKEGQTIGLLEIMKLTLEVVTGCGGEVVGVLAGDRQLVSLGQKIMAIRRREQVLELPRGKNCLSGKGVVQGAVGEKVHR